MIEVNANQLKEKLHGAQDYIKTVASDSKNKLQNRYHETADSVQKTYRDVSQKIGKAATQLQHLSEATQEKVETAVNRADETVKTNPWKVLAAAVVTALFVGYWLKPAR